MTRRRTYAHPEPWGSRGNASPAIILGGLFAIVLLATALGFIIGRWG